MKTARAAVTSDALTQKADAELLAKGYVSRETYEHARSTYVSSLETLRSTRQAVRGQEATLRTALSKPQSEVKTKQQSLRILLVSMLRGQTSNCFKRRSRNRRLLRRSTAK